jgi:hypothetical protein
MHFEHGRKCELVCSTVTLISSDPDIQSVPFPSVWESRYSRHAVLRIMTKGLFSRLVHADSCHLLVIDSLTAHRIVDQTVDLRLSNYPFRRTINTIVRRSLHHRTLAVVGYSIMRILQRDAPRRVGRLRLPFVVS